MDRNRGGRPRHPDVLTPAEWRVLEALRDGGTNAGIGARLGLSLDTVKYHISNMLAKLELRDRRALAAWRPEEPRGRLRGAFAILGAIGAVARPLVWVGVGAAAVAGVAVVVAALVALEAVVERDSGAPAAVARLPVTPSTAPPAVTVAPTATPSVFAAEPALAPSATPPAAPSPTPAGTPEPRASPTPAASAPAPGSCTTPTDPTCIHAVYRGAPADYAQVADIPADKLLTQASDGRYHVERGQQYTVVTAAALPAGWTRFWLDLTPLEFGVPSPVSASQLIKPIGTTFTFTVSRETGAPTDYLSGYPEGYTFEGPAQFSYNLKAAKPFVRPRPDGKPLIGHVVLTVVFQTAQFAYDSFDDTGMAATPGSYGFLMPNAETEGATEPVTTYEQMRTLASALVVNVMNGGAQEGFYDGIEDGELLEWREAEDCWTRFMVTGAPSGTGDARTVPVKPYAYSGYGCSGAVSSDTAVTFDWDPGVIPTVAIGAPVNYGFGRWVLVPYKNNWDGRVPLVYEDVEIPPDPPRTVPHPLYSAPDVPDDWVQTFIGWPFDGGRFRGYGYGEQYASPDGQPALQIYVTKLGYRPVYINAAGAGRYIEARVIEGYPAVVRYVPEYFVDWLNRGDRTWVEIYDVDRDLLVRVEGKHRSLWASNIDGTIAIALSILRGGE